MPKTVLLVLLTLLALPTPVAVVWAQTNPSYSRVITPSSFPRIQNIVAVLDVNGDGRDDLIVEGHPGPDILNPCTSGIKRQGAPMTVLLSNGDGTFRDGTAAVIVGTLPAMVVRRAVVGDFNNDGRPDVALFDSGTFCTFNNLPNFISNPPILLLSQPDGQWHTSSALADAIAKIHAERFPRFAGSDLHVNYASAGDINNDGHLDIWVESCGGQNLCSHFLMNNGDGTFTAAIDRVPVEVLHNPQPEFWRHHANALVDLNNDGYLDLLLGQQRDTDPTHINQTSLVIFNDGTGHFPLANRVLLPRAEFFQGLTVLLSLVAVDLDGDGLKDLILPHTRNEPPISAPGFRSGRYVQVLMNRGGGRFVDETASRMRDQSATTPEQSAVYGEPLKNALYGAATVVDVNGDGFLDLVMANSRTYLGREAPLVYLNDGTGHFTVMDPDIFTAGELYFGENSVSLDLNGDGVVDFVHPDLLPGADGVYGTGDEVTRLIALIGRQAQAPPVLAAAILPGSRAVQAGTTATVFATILASGPATAIDCTVAPSNAIAGTTFLYQQTYATNVPIGRPNTPANIGSGGSQSFVISLTPSAAFPATDLLFAFDCANTARVAVLPGVNTLLLTSTSTPGPDIVALAATVTNDGIANIPGATGTGFFSVATVNVGAGAPITATVDTGGVSLPVTLSLCETNPGTGACINPVSPGSSATVQIDAGQTPTFAIFAQGSGTVAFTPDVNRAFVRFKAAGATVGATSVALRTQ